MAKFITDVLLKDGTDETTFINDVTSNDEVDLKDRVTSLNNMVVLSVEENYLDTLKSHASVLNAEFFEDDPAPVTYPSIPSTYTLSNKSIGGTAAYTSVSGQKYLSLQHYLDTDIMPSPDDRTVNGYTSNKVGNSYFQTSPDGRYDSYRYLGTEPSSSSGQAGNDQTYFTTYTGKHVDLVVLEGGTEAPSHTGWHDSHPDYDDPDNPGTTRMIPMNWTGLSNIANNQVSNNTMLNDHSVGTLSVSGGVYCGFAKKASMRACYITGDGITAGLNSIKSWHNSKSNNATTGLPNPTVLIIEWHSPAKSKEISIRLDDVISVTDPTGGTTNRPGSGWGTDFTPFVSRDIIPFQLLDPIDNNWYWVVPMARQTDATYFTAFDQCWDDGIVIVSSNGNGGSVYANRDDARYNGTYVTTSGTINQYTMSFNASGSQNDGCQLIRGLTSTTTWYCLRSYGPGGNTKAINVAAGGNSGGMPTLDGYSSRGSGVDVVGRGSSTWSAGHPSDTTMGDGYKWNLFGGTSCAVPTVGGKAACWMEKYYTLNGAWPSPNQVKAAMISEVRATPLSVKTTNWSSVPTASGTDINPQQHISSSPCLKIQAGTTAPNGGHRMVDLAGTPPRQAFWNAQNFNREQTYKKRPTTGVLFPRPRKFDIAPVEQAAT